MNALSVRDRRVTEFIDKISLPGGRV